jgi:hypothetical protein
MISKTVQKFLESHNCTYLYLLLAGEELERLSKLPYNMKRELPGKITTVALEHVATGNIPDYFIPEEEKPEGKITDIIDE